MTNGACRSGIGAAVARAFAKAGCTRFAITDINAASLDRTRDAILQISPKAEVHSKEGDISNETFVDSFVKTSSQNLGRIDYSVHCAGVLGESLRSHETPTSHFDRINNINYKGTWLTSRAVLSQMLNQKPLPESPGQKGAIVNIASQLGIVGRPTAGKDENALS